MMFSTFATSFSVIERRVPDGAFRLITNCAASVRGKKESPSNGKIARLAAHAPPIISSMEPGRRSTTPTHLSYTFRNDSNRWLNQTLNRSPNDHLRRGRSTVRATANEAKRESATASASAENRNLLTP